MDRRRTRKIQRSAPVVVTRTQQPFTPPCHLSRTRARPPGTAFQAASSGYHHLRLQRIPGDYRKVQGRPAETLVPQRWVRAGVDKRGTKGVEPDVVFKIEGESGLEIAPQGPQVERCEAELIVSVQQ